MKHHINIFERFFNCFRVAYISNNGFYGLRFAVLFKKSIKINKIKIKKKQPTNNNNMKINTLDAEMGYR